MILIYFTVSSCVSVSFVLIAVLGCQRADCYWYCFALMRNSTWSLVWGPLVAFASSDWSLVSLVSCWLLPDIKWALFTSADPCCHCSAVEYLLTSRGFYLHHQLILVIIGQLLNTCWHHEGFVYIGSWSLSFVRYWLFTDIWVSFTSSADLCCHSSAVDCLLTSSGLYLLHQLILVLIGHLLVICWKHVGFTDIIIWSLVSYVSCWLIADIIRVLHHLLSLVVIDQLLINCWSHSEVNYTSTDPCFYWPAVLCSNRMEC